MLEFIRADTELDEDGVPLEASGFLAPVVLAEKCNGCGLCETRCNQVNAKGKGVARKARGPGAGRPRQRGSSEDGLVP